MTEPAGPPPIATERTPAHDVDLVLSGLGPEAERVASR